MPTLGDTVNYRPNITGAESYAAYVIGVHDDGSADLKVALGYCQGWSDVQNVPESADGSLGTFFPPGTVPAEKRDVPYVKPPAPTPNPASTFFPRSAAPVKVAVPAPVKTAPAPVKTAPAPVAKRKVVAG